MRGSGRAESAAVCILETHSSRVTDAVRGLVRQAVGAPQPTGRVAVTAATRRRILPSSINSWVSFLTVPW